MLKEEIYNIKPIKYNRNYELEIKIKYKLCIFIIFSLNLFFQEKINLKINFLGYKTNFYTEESKYLIIQIHRDITLLNLNIIK